jgi:hypothetical protein
MRENMRKKNWRGSKSDLYVTKWIGREFEFDF